MAGNLVERYCKSTTVHGLKYLVGKQNSFQKLFWAAMIVLSVICTLCLIASLIGQVTKNPITIYRDDKPIDITKIPFPAFTVCDLGNASYEDFDLHMTWMEDFYIPTFELLTEHGRCSLVNFCDQERFLRGDKQVYKKIESELEELMLENRTQPFVTPSSKLGIDGEIEHSEFYGATRFNGGDRLVLMIHSPYELPTKEHRKFNLAAMDHDTFLVTPQLNTIDDTMIEMKPNERGCFLPHEKELTLYKVYNEANCKAECQSNFIADSCGCVPEYIVANESVAICNFTSNNCANEADLKFIEGVISKCDCLLACNDLKYLTERTKRDFTNSNYAYRSSGINGVIFEIRIKAGDHYPIVRRKTFTVSEIFAYTGGLLGLFLGISVVSLAELIDAVLQPVFKKLSYPQRGMTSNSHRKNRFTTNVSKLKSYFSFYLKESSIHSFNFIANANNCLERIFWFLVFSVSMTGCVFMILQLYKNTDFKAVTLVIDDQLKDVSTVPFPAVTIFGRFPHVYKISFPEIKSLDEIYFMGSKKHNMSIFDTAVHRTSKIAAVGLITGTTFELPYKSIVNFTDHEKYIVEEIKAFTTIEWFRESNGSFGRKFSVPFSEMMTNRGSGFSFNILDFDELLKAQKVSGDFQYQSTVILNKHLDERKKTFPWHASTSESLNLEILIDVDLRTQFLEAFSVHPNNELPMMLLPLNIFEFAGGKHLEVLITPSVIVSDENLRTLDPSDRSCYFQYERKLKFFKIYTQRNCMIECFSNHSQQLCGCVPFDIIRDNEIPVCGITRKDRKCQFMIEKDFSDYQPTGKINSCSCLSSCDMVTYDIEIRELKLNDKEYENITQLSFKFGVEVFNPLRRTRRYTVIDFLSYAGGVLGLFAGISVLSFFEVFYFFSLRLVSNFLVPRKIPRHDIINVRPAKQMRNK